MCLSWNSRTSEWSDTGVEVISPIEEPENGEFKVFQIRCYSDHLAPFGVAVEVPTTSVGPGQFCAFLFFSLIIGVDVIYSSLYWVWICHIQFSSVYVFPAFILVMHTSYSFL